MIGLFVLISILIMIRYSFYKRKQIITGLFFILVYFLWCLMDFGIDPEKFNYFGDIESRRNVGLLLPPDVDCKILNLSAWDPKIKPFLKKLPEIECDPQSVGQWVYVDRTSLMVNKSAIISSGYEIKSISCCYNTISRVSETLEDYSGGADVKIDVSRCEPITEEKTEMFEEFIRVECTNKIPTFLGEIEILFQQYFMLALPHKNNKMRKTIDFWTNSEGYRPPNVLLLGVDSMSRLNFIRNMPKTRKILDKIGGFEFLGYTKVADNTFPNSVAHLSGHYLEDLEKICIFSPKSPQDFCPYIWRDFSENNYFTALLDDQPEISGFNLKKWGFVGQPTDFYPRPLILAKIWKWGFETLNTDKVHDFCFGYEKSVKVHLKYIQDLLEMSRNVKVPIFIYSWQGLFSHDDINGAQTADEEFEQFFQNHFENTLVVFLSDHGQRHGKIRTTFAGWFEDKLPNLYMVLSQDLKKRYPNWIENLESNSKSLTSPFDIYQTLAEILQITSRTKIPPSKTLMGNEVLRKHGLSLLSSKILPSRNCKSAGIPPSFCACSIPHPIPRASINLNRAAEKAVDFINSKIPQSVCSPLSLKFVQSGAYVDSKKAEFISYIVSFTTQPGDFKFEANVEYIEEKDTFQVNSTTDIQRISKIDTDSSCVSDPVIELLCLCSNL